MKFAWNAPVYAWRVTGFIGNGGQWFAGVSRARDPQPNTWSMPSDPELFEFINSTPLVQSLLYDINLLPECVGDGRQWAYMVAVCEHMKAALTSKATGQ
jgi:hypothetical protein